MSRIQVETSVVQAAAAQVKRAGVTVREAAGDLTDSRPVRPRVPNRTCSRALLLYVVDRADVLRDCLRLSSRPPLQRRDRL